MPNNNQQPTKPDSPLFDRVATILEQARSNVVRSVNSEMVIAYWLVGQEIVEEEQQGKKRAGYGKRLIADLSQRLTQRYEKGFSVAHLKNIRQFHLTFRSRMPEIGYTPGSQLPEPKSYTVSSELTMPDKSRQMGDQLLETKGYPVDVIKDPYVLEFLDLPESPRLVESELENALISRLQDFLLEPGLWLCFHRQADPINTGRRSFLPRLDLLSRPAQVLCCNRSQGRQTEPRRPREEEIYCLISKSGFTKRMKKLAANDNVLLFDLKDLEMEFLGGNGGVPQPESADRSAYISSDTDQRL